MTFWQDFRQIHFAVLFIYPLILFPHNERNHLINSQQLEPIQPSQKDVEKTSRSKPRISSRPKVLNYWQRFNKIFYILVGKGSYSIVVAAVCNDLKSSASTHNDKEH